MFVETARANCWTNLSKMDTVAIFSMKDVERLTGIKAHTIRIWEKRYGILEPQRTSTNIRYFNNDEVRLLLTIRMLNGYGHKISAIVAMSGDERARRLNEELEMRSGPAHVEETLLISLLEAEEWRFSKIFYSMVYKEGLEQAFIRHLMPFFERVGILWQTGAIEPAQEHFFFNMVRQKLIAATDGLGSAHEPSQPVVLLFLPEHELHELALLFYNFAFRNRGCRTVYLGQSVPLVGLERMLRLTKPGYIVTGMTNNMNPMEFHQFYAQLRQIAGMLPVYFTGPEPSRLKDEYDELLVTEDLIRLLESMPVKRH